VRAEGGGAGELAEALENRFQCFTVHWFCKRDIDSGFGCLTTIINIGVSGQGNQEWPLDETRFSNPPGDFKPGDSRHGEIEENDIRLMKARRLQGLTAVAGSESGMSPEFQHHGGGRDHVRFIIHHENTERCGARRRIVEHRHSPER
jgi:hypothetical protein